MKPLEDSFQSSVLEQEFQDLILNPLISTVSLDIFDTLFFRRCGIPKNVFEIMGKNEEILAFFDTPQAFSQYRQNAEKDARKLFSNKEDITLEEIYAQLPISQKNRQRFKEIELSVEKEMLVVNTQLDRWIKFAADARKRVILLSDMYLSSCEVEEIALSKLTNRDKISNIYMSNECGSTKATGTLFQYVMQELDLNPQEIVHIGDNQRSDILIPQNFGIQTLYYGQNQEQKERFRYESLYMKEGFSDGNQVRNLSSLLNPYKDDLQRFYFNIGASVFAPLLWEFSHWLADTANRFNTKQISFIMREGAIFEKCFTMLYPEVQTNLLYASRKSTNFLTLSADDIGSVNFALYKAFTIYDLYKSFFIEIDDDKIRCHADTLYKDANNICIENQTLLTLVTSDIHSKTTVITNAIEAQKKFLSEYLKDSNVNKETSLVDFGGGGTIIKRLTEFLPPDLSPRTNILFYQHAQGYKKLSNKHILSFLPYTKSTAGAIESIHRTPEFIEILLNGVNKTTACYDIKDGKISANTYLPKSNKNNLSKIVDSFLSGIELFFKLSKSYDLAKKTYNRENLTLMLARVIELPTHDEVKFFGELEYDEGKASDNFYQIIDERKIQYVQEQSIERIYQEFLLNPIKHRARLPWVEGVITKLSPNYLLKFYGTSTDPNQEIINELILKLESSKQKKVMVYGAGELFTQFLPYLKETNIEIEALIDSRAEVKQFQVEGYDVISLAEAFNDKEKATIVIASGVFYGLIKQHIEKFAMEQNKKINILNF